MKIFFATFLLVFLAELGDKTQLTVLAQSARHDQWLVALAGCLALCASTLLAAWLGGYLQRWLPPKYIQLASALLFLLFGTLLLLDFFRSPPPS